MRAPVDSGGREGLHRYRNASATTLQLVSLSPRSILQWPEEQSRSPGRLEAAKAALLQHMPAAIKSPRCLHRRKPLFQVIELLVLAGQRLSPHIAPAPHCHTQHHLGRASLRSTVSRVPPVVPCAAHTAAMDGPSLSTNLCH